MRKVRWVLVLAAALGLGARVQAQTLPAEMVVTATQVEVRSGPTKEYYATGVLRQGDRVLVLRESKDQPGWLAIKPPAGSFSWINAKHIKQVDPRTGYVEVESGPVPVMPGSSVTNKAPNVEAVKIAPGFIVTIVDKAFTVDGNTWVPIQPPPTEVRFIPADAVRPSGAGVPFTPTTVKNPLIGQADAAFSAGQYDKAKSLYKEAADRTSNYQEKAYCYTRLDTIENGLKSAPGHPFHTASGKSPAPVPIVPASGKAITYPPQWSTWGVLKKAAFEKDGQPVYILESRDARALLYVVSSPGTSLREYLGRTICVYGSTTYRSDDPMRTHYLVASHVAVP